MNPAVKRVFIRLLLAAGCLAILGFVVFLVWRIQLANDINQQLAAIRAAGLPTNGEELNKFYPAVSDNENAALVMTQAFALMRDFPDSRSNEVARYEWPAPLHITPEQKQLLSDYVKINSNAISKVSEAIKLPKSRYPVDFSPNLAMQLGWGAFTFRGLARADEFEALLALDSGRPSDADIAAKNLIGMAKTLDDMPLLMTSIIRMALLNLASDIVRARVNAGGLKEDELVNFELAFASVEKANALERATIGERALRIPYYLLNPTNIEQIRAQIHEPDLLPLESRLLLLGTGFQQRDLRYYLNIAETNIEIAKSPPPHQFDFERARNIAVRQHYLLTASVLVMAFPFELNDKTLANLRLTKAAIASERFRLARGRLPENLNELVPQFLSAVPLDPFDDLPLRYHRLAKGYVIYSVGPDGHDDGGRERPAHAKSSDKTPYDITFTVER
jgi:hypothetical protein